MRDGRIGTKKPRRRPNKEIVFATTGIGDSDRKINHSDTANTLGVRPTRQAWVATGLASGVLAIGVLAERVLVVFAGVGILGWLLGQQVVAVREFEAADSAVTVSLLSPQERVPVDEEVEVAVRVTTNGPLPTTVTVQPAVPVGAQGVTNTPETVTLEPGSETAVTTFSCSFPTPGAYEFPTPEIEMTAANGMVTQAVARGTTPTVTVTAHTPDPIHVGQGGDQIATAYGAHEAGQGSGGTTPAELRQYVPGDSVDKIDWNATARLGEPYVREFEAETDRQTQLIVDHRSSMTAGPQGATALDYARAVALGLLQQAESVGDPVGCQTVGPSGSTSRFHPRASPDGYAAIRERLQSLTVLDSDNVTSTAGGPRRVHRNVPAQTTRLAVAQRRADRLAQSATPFAERLAPFFAARERYVTETTDKPLFAAVRESQARSTGQTLTLIVTTDTERAALREAVEQAATRGSVLVFLIPQVLFASASLTAIEATYNRYVEFEEYRRELTRLTGVEAFEVGPQDRLDALLASRARSRA